MRGVKALGVVAALAGLVGVGVVGWRLLGSGSSGEVRVVDDSTEAAPAEARAALLSGRTTAPAKADLASATYAIRGVVLDPSKKPAAGVRVTATREGPVWDPDDPSTWGLSDRRDGRVKFLSGLDAPTTGERKPDSAAASGVDGTFTLSVTESGRYTVRARPEPPRVGSSRFVALRRLDAERQVVLDLVEGTSLHGRVLEADGRPAGAVVTGRWDDRAMPDGYSTDPTATDPKTGEFEWPAVPSGRASVSLVVPGRLSMSGLDLTTPRTDVFEIRLGEGGVVRGRIADAAGHAVAGADVAVTTSTGSTAGTGRAKSGSDGGYRIEGVPFGSVSNVTVLAADYTVLDQSPPRAPWSGAEVKATAEAVIDLVLVKGGTIEGQVVAEKTGEPVADANVLVLRTDSGNDGYGLPPPVAVDARGRFRAEGQALGKYVLLARSPTHYLAALEPSSSPVVWDGESRGAPPDVTVVLTKEGETATRTLVLRKGLAVRGRVVGPDGAPVEGASVRSAQPVASNWWQWGLRTNVPDLVLATSGPDGSFEATGVPPRDGISLVAWKADLVGEPSESFSLSAGTPPPALTLRLVAGATISGRVVDGSGQPVASANVWAWSQAPGWRRNASDSAALDGTFTLKGIPAGRCTIGANGPRGGASAQTALDPPLSAGEVRKDVVLKIDQGSASVSGVVVDGAGNPLVGKQVSAMVKIANGNTQRWGATRGDGTFTIDGLTASEVTVSVQEPDDAGNYRGGTGSASVTTTAPATGLRLVYVAPKRTTVSGRVVDASGQPVPLCSVTVKPAAPGGGADRGAQVVYAGSWGDGQEEVVGGEFRRSVSGDAPFEVVVSRPRDDRGRPMNLKGTTVSCADPTVPLVVTLEAGAEVSGTVVGPEGEPIEGARVRAEGSPAATTDAEGKFRIGALSKDEIDLTVTPPGRFQPPAPMHVRSGQKDVLIRLSPGAAISGVVLGPDGKPWRNASINAQWRGDGRTGNAQAQPGADGRFRLEGMPADAVADVQVWPWSPDGSRPARQARVQGVRVDTTDLVIRLEAGFAIEGTVVTTDGTPAAISSIDVARDGGGADAGGWSTNVSEGTFSVQGLAPGTYTLTPRSNQGVASGEPVKVTAPAKGVRLVVSPIATIKGRVDGAFDRTKTRVEAILPADEAGGTRSASGQPSDDGAFSLEVAADREYVVRIVVQDDDRYGLVSGVRPGGPEVTVRLEPGQSIAGTLADGGAPASKRGLWVKSDRWSAGARTDDAGRFRIRGLPPGRYAVLLWVDAAGKQVEIGQADAGDVEVRLNVPR